MSVDQSRDLNIRVARQPTVQELLDDPTTRLLMERDGVSREDVRNLLASAQMRLAIEAHCPRSGNAAGRA